MEYPNFLHEKMFDQSDKFIINLCVPCKSYFKVVKTQNGFFCSGCNGINIVKFNCPFAAKLFFSRTYCNGSKIRILKLKMNKKLNFNDHMVIKFKA